MYICTITIRNVEKTVFFENSAMLCSMHQFSCRFGQCDSWVCSCGRRRENKDLLIINIRMKTPAFSLSADGCEEHSLDRTDSMNYKEVTQFLISLSPAVRHGRPAWNHGHLHFWILLMETTKQVCWQFFVHVHLFFAYFLSGFTSAPDLRHFLVVLSNPLQQLKHFDRLWLLRLGEAAHWQWCILDKY